MWNDITFILKTCIAYINVFIINKYNNINIINVQYLIFGKNKFAEILQNLTRYTHTYKSKNNLIGLK